MNQPTLRPVWLARLGTACWVALFALITPMSHAQTYDFNGAWKQVTDLEAKNLTRQALEQTQRIQVAADQESNDPQYLKAMLHEFKYIQRIEEKSDSLIEARMRAELGKGGPARQAVVHSMLAEMYATYYQQNSWRFYSRTETAIVPDDYLTWDAKIFYKEIVKHYLASVEDVTALQAIPIRTYRHLLTTQEKSETFRPTLYDLLAFRAIDFFKSTAGMFPERPTGYRISSDLGLAGSAIFAETSLPEAKPGTPAYEVLRLFQALIRFHLADKAPDALVFAELERLRYVPDVSQPHVSNEELIRHYDLFAAQYEGNSIQGEILMAKAERLAEEGHRYGPNDRDPVAKGAYQQAAAIADKVLREFPKSAAADHAKALLSQLNEKSLKLTVESVNLPEQPFRALLNYRNVPTVYFRVVKLTDKLKKDLEGLDYYGQEDRLARILRKQPVIHQWTSKLPSTEDFQRHALELKVPGLPVGSYLLIVADDKGLSVNKHAIHHVEWQVSSMAYSLTQRNEEESHELLVVDRKTGEPLSGVRVKVYREEMTDRYYRRNQSYPKYEQSVQTSEEGFLRLPYRYSREIVGFELIKGAEKIRTNQVIGRKDNSPFGETAAQSVKLLTDRAIYRPGQTIYVKAIAYESQGDNRQLLTNRPLTLTLYDVNNQEISQQEVQTNDFGSAQAVFTAPATGLTGQMAIRTDHGYVAIRVEEYKRPTFEVNMDTVKESFVLNEAITVSGKALSYAGANLTNAQVKYRVVRTQERPWNFWRYYYRPTPPVDIAQGETTTDEAGTFTITFDAKATVDESQEKGRPTTYRFEVIVDVVDISGETHTGQSFVRVGTQPLEIKAKLPEVFSQASIPEIELVTQNLNGNFVPAEGTVSIVALTDPGRILRTRRWERPDAFLYAEDAYVATFPYDVFDQEDDFRFWPEGETVWETTVNTANTKTLLPIDLATATPGKYKLTYAAEGVSYTTFFSLEGVKAKSPAVATLLHADLNKAVAEPGETLLFTLNTSAKRLHVYYRLIQQQSVLNEKWVELKKGETQIEIPIQESYRGNVAIELTYFWENTYQIRNYPITVPWSNKELQLEWMSFRSPLQPGQKEQWQLKISGPKAEAVSAEMVATLYDASLDEFVSHGWAMDLYPTYNHYSRANAFGFNTTGSESVSKDWNVYSRFTPQAYDQLNWHGFYFGYGYLGGVALDEVVVTGSSRSRPRLMARKGRAAESEAAFAAAPVAYDAAIVGEKEENFKSLEEQKPPSPPGEVNAPTDAPASPTPRRNLNETAFFFPQLTTNAQGEIILNFTMPEALTRWKFMGLAHTKDLKVGQLAGETVTQKELMVTPNLPRFFRDGDTLTLTAKLTNLTEETLSGEAELKLFDAQSMQPIEAAFAHDGSKPAVEIPAKGNSVVSWQLIVPDAYQAVAIQVFAKAGDFTDGEEKILPVLTNRMLVTESMPFSLKGKEKKKTLHFEKLLNSGSSSTLKHQQLTFEVSSNPAWYAVQALPYLMEYPHECTEQIFSRFYANTLASHVANSNPRIQQMFTQWQQAGGEALLSNLEKNQELKQALLAETPWVLEARDESERKRRMGLLFDLNRMGNESDYARQQLVNRQLGDGSFSWFPGMDGSRYITQLIVTGFGHLQHLGIEASGGNPEISGVLSEAVAYLDKQLVRDYQSLKKNKADLKEDHLGYTQIQYLYMRSFYQEIPIANAKANEAFEYYYGQAKEFWPKKSLYMQGMLSLVLHRYTDPQIADEVILGLKENAVMSPALGMYWKNPGGWYWYQAPIEQQALMIEAFAEVSHYPDAVEDMQYWLIQHKRTNDWKTTRATVAACNALLLTGQNYLSDQPLVTAKLGDEKIDPTHDPNISVEAGTGYYQVSWQGTEVKPEMGELSVKKPGKNPAYGAVYWQYFEQLDKITYAETPLKIQKTLYKQVAGEEGPILTEISPETPLQPGDLIKVRLDIKLDRAMQYVHMKDMRAAGFEPINVLSGYKYQGGLGYYESTRDAATDFFFEYLPAGTWVFEYPLRANLPGAYSNGVTTIQCMYAPEFTSHSEGMRISVSE